MYHKAEENKAVPTVLIGSGIMSQDQVQDQQSRKPLIKIDTKTRLIINKIPATIKAMKRSTPNAEASSDEPVSKSGQYVVQSDEKCDPPLDDYQWQQTEIASELTTSPNSSKQQQIGAAINSLPANTIIQPARTTTTYNAKIYYQPLGCTTITPNTSIAVDLATVGAAAAVQPSLLQKGKILQFHRQNFVKLVPEQSIRAKTIEFIEKDPLRHLGVPRGRMQLLKNVICARLSISITDCYLTLKKLRTNDDFSTLADYFERDVEEVQRTFTRTITKLSSYLRFLIRWPDKESYYNRFKTLPFAYRSNLSNVHSMIECVETDMNAPFSTSIDCFQYKYILCITPNNVISYVSDAFHGSLDDLAIFKASNFLSFIPPYLSLTVEPGLGIRRKRAGKSHSGNNNGDNDSNTDSADESSDGNDSPDENIDSMRPVSKYVAMRIASEVAGDRTLQIVNNELTSTEASDVSVPTMRIRERFCRPQMRHMINTMHEFRILQPYAIRESLLFQYLNEILIVVAGFINLAN